MAFEIDKKGNIKLIQGDSGSIYLEGLKTDKNYNLFFAIQDKNRKKIGNEIKISTNKSPIVVIELTGSYTDLMTVPKDEEFEIYTYGIKICTENNEEETLLIGESDIGEINTITVFPKKVEGT